MRAGGMVVLVPSTPDGAQAALDAVPALLTAFGMSRAPQRGAQRTRTPFDCSIVQLSGASVQVVTSSSSTPQQYAHFQARKVRSLQWGRNLSRTLL